MPTIVVARGSSSVSSSRTPSSAGGSPGSYAQEIDCPTIPPEAPTPPGPRRDKPRDEHVSDRPGGTGEEDPHATEGTERIKLWPYPGRPAGPARWPPRGCSPAASRRSPTGGC